MSRGKTRPASEISPGVLRAVQALGAPASGVAADALRAAAERSGIPANTWKSWDARGFVPPSALARIARSTGRSLDWLIGADEVQDASDQAGAAGCKSKKSGAVAHLPPPEDATPDAHSTQLQKQEKRNRGAFAAPPDAPSASHFPAREPPPPPLTAPRHAPLPAPLTLHLQAQDGQHQQQIAYAVIPHLRGGAAAGAGGVAAVLDDGAALADAERAGVIALQWAWLKQKLGAAVGPLASVEVIGDGMLPTLRSGDTVILDSGCQVVRERGLYVLKLRGLRVIKRVRVAIDESVQVSEDADPAAAETVAARDVDRLQVVGRIVWPRDW
jgi:hypothetical protein